MATALTQLLGKPVRYVAISAEEAREAMLAGGLPAAAADLVSALRAYEREGHNAAITTTIAELLGRPPHLGRGGGRGLRDRGVKLVSGERCLG